MKRIYADLHLCPDLRDLEQVLRMANKALTLGYRLAAITFPFNYAREVERLKELLTEADIDLAFRLDLKPRTPSELVRSLRKFRRRFDVVGVVCESKNVARQAAKDRRVDLLNFPSLDFRRRFFDRAEAELAANALASVEVDVKPLLVLEGAARVKLLSSLRREVAVAREFDVPVVMSSGVSDELYMRKPRELAALACLFDLDKVSAVAAVSSNPVGIVRRNREKLSQRFVAPGIRIVRRGKDC
jgi:ribonuclease P/MRP protein subunit RPP1